jgi:hypothetical protein
MYWNWAIISPKAECGSVASGGFFRASSESRSQDFGRQLTGSQFRCLPINTDKYVILKHKRFRIGGMSRGWGAGNTKNRSLSGSNYMNFFTYVKLNRQLR